MAGFRFKFQPVLNLKKQVEDVRKFEMAKAVSQLEDEKERLCVYESTENIYIQSVSEEVSGGMDLHRIKECNSYILHMRNLINGQKQLVSQAETKVDESRERLKEALVEKKTMENLRSRHVRAYIIEQRRKEQLVTDEITSYKYKMTTSGD